MPPGKGADVLLARTTGDRPADHRLITVLGIVVGLAFFILKYGGEEDGE